MKYFIDILQLRNWPLFVFGCANLLAALVFSLLTIFSKSMIRGTNAWLKPFKFALSIAIFSFTMGWYTYDLHQPAAVSIYNWVVILLLGFEVVYIALQAGRGQLSHYNISSPVYSFLTILMGVAAVIATLWTGYIGLLFFNADVNLPYYYVLSIQLGIFIFVFFAFQGASMGARSTHTVGGPEGGPAVPFLNWSKQYGDLRIAHFIGMHALQIVPLLSWYILKNTFATVALGLFYAALAAITLVRALQGKSFLRNTKAEKFSVN